MSKYKVPDNEKDVYHVQVTRNEFDPATGKPLFQPFVQKYTPDEFKIFKQFPHGYAIEEVLHDPTVIEIPPPAQQGKK
jgi:hypothetical protein